MSDFQWKNEIWEMMWKLIIKKCLMPIIYRRYNVSMKYEMRNKTVMKYK